MLTQITPTLIALLAFGAVAIAVFVLGQHLTATVRVQQRIGDPSHRLIPVTGLTSQLDRLASTYFDERRFGIEGAVRTKLRRDLVCAGFFQPGAINYYIFARLAVVGVLTIAAYIAAQTLLVSQPWWVKLGLVAIALLLGVFGPDAYISRRQRTMQQNYRLAFPDLLDLMVVCVDAGLSLEAAFDRLSREIARQNYYLGANLLIMGAEIRAGRRMIDALASLADRLGLDEARSFTGVLRQSIDLGTDVGEALHVFSDEMRDRRLLRAEERANQLPVKMILPLGLFIFPVILLVSLYPVLIRLASVLT
jgi:tight adherence protein C